MMMMMTRKIMVKGGAGEGMGRDYIEVGGRGERKKFYK